MKLWASGGARELDLETPNVGTVLYRCAKFVARPLIIKHSFESCKCVGVSLMISVCVRRFHSLIWVEFDMDVTSGSSGRLIGGCENGSVTVFGPDVILAAGEDAVIGQSNKHTGPVRALDYNRFQVDLAVSFSVHSRLVLALRALKCLFPSVRVISSRPVPTIQKYTSGT